MSIRQYVNPSMGPRYVCSITTVDPQTRKIEAKIKDGGEVLVSVFDIPPFFVWPQVNERWIIRKDGNYWKLDTRLDTDLDYTFDKLNPGEGKIGADIIKTPTGKTVIAIDNLTATEGQVIGYKSGSWVPVDQTGGTGTGSANTIRYGATVPSDSLGSNGDFYINTITNTLFGPKAGGVWPSGVALIGPTGLTGNPGVIQTIAPVSGSPITVTNGSSANPTLNISTGNGLSVGSSTLSINTSIVPTISTNANNYTLVFSATNLAANTTLTVPASAGNSGDIVTTAGTQTLTNKSISGEQINSGTVSNTYLPLATTGATGIASFDLGDFAVSSGAVTVKAQGIDLAQLTRSSSANTVLIGNGSSADSTYGNVAGSQFATAAPNTGVLAYEATGGSTTTPSFRTLVASDIPDASITGGAAGSGVKIAATTITNANISTAAAIVPTKTQIAGVALSPSASQTVPNGTTTDLAFNTVTSYGSYSGIITGTAGTYSSGTHSVSGTITANVACWVQVSAGIVWTNANTGTRGIVIRRYSSSDVLTEQFSWWIPAGNPLAHTAGSITMNMTANQYIVVAGYQNQTGGGALGYSSGINVANLKVTVLGVV